MSGNIENQEKTAEEAGLEKDAANQTAGDGAAKAGQSEAAAGVGGAKAGQGEATGQGGAQEGQSLTGEEVAAKEKEEEEDGVASDASEEEAAEEGGDAVQDGGDAGQETKEKRSFFKKKEKKDKKDEKIDELNDRLMRTMAEFDNFRKRTEKEKAQMFEVGAKSIVEKILPVVDNFERGLASVPEEEKGSSFVQGMELVYKQLMKYLEDAGVTPIEAVGKEFNPDFHNAVMHAEDENFGENIVSEEFQKGYMYRSTVVRHSMVKVVN